MNADTAEDVGASKPTHDHFIRFRDTFGAGSQRWVHVAQSHVHDIVPAHELAIPSVWINRRGEAANPSIAGAVLPNLTSWQRRCSAFSWHLLDLDRLARASPYGAALRTERVGFRWALSVDYARYSAGATVPPSTRQ